MSDGLNISIFRAMETIKSNLDRVKTPGVGDRVYKDECFFSFDSPECDRGLYVCLNRWIGVGHKYLSRYSNRTDNKIFLHIKRTRKVRIPFLFLAINNLILLPGDQRGA